MRESDTFGFLCAWLSPQKSLMYFSVSADVHTTLSPQIQILLTFLLYGLGG